MIEQLKKHPFFSDKTIESCTLLEHQGYCNENYLLVADGVKYIVRKLLRDDIDRAFEWKVQNLAFENGITAEPLVFDSQNGFMIFSFLEGEHKSLEVETSVPLKLKTHSTGGSKLTTSEDDLKLLAKTLQKLHSISIDAEPIELQIDTSIIECYSKEYVLCHNDLNAQNVFFSDDIKFIDFEYAGVNDRYFDVACVCVEFKLDMKMQKMFLEVYFEGKYSLEKLEAYKMVYKALCEEWFQKNL